MLSKRSRSIFVAVAVAFSATLSGCLRDSQKFADQSLASESNTNLVIIEDERTCSGCAVLVEDILRLDDSLLAPMPGSPSSVVEDSLGRYWLLYLNHLP